MTKPAMWMEILASQRVALNRNIPPVVVRAIARLPPSLARRSDAQGDVADWDAVAGEVDEGGGARGYG